MSEKVETKKNEGEKKAAVDGGVKAATDDGVKKEAGPITVVLKLDLHCEGCAKKVRRSINHLEGVEKVKADWDARMLTVTGNVDPTWLRDTVANKTKKKVELLSPPPPPPPPHYPKQNPQTTIITQKQPKEAVISSNVVMKMKLHCDGCAHKIKRIISKNIEGVTSVTADFQKDLVTAIGTMDVNELISYLRDKLKRDVQIVPPEKNKNDEANEEKKKKEEASGGEGGEKKEKGKNDSHGGEEKEKEKEKVKEKQGDSGTGTDTGIDGSGEKKMGELKAVDEKKGGGDDDDDGVVAPKIEVSKMEHRNSYDSQTYYAMPPVYDQTTYGNHSNHDYGSSSSGSGMSMYHHQGYNSNPEYYAAQYPYGPPPPPPTFLNDNDGMFSDENPNGCFIM